MNPKNWLLGTVLASAMAWAALSPSTAAAACSCGGSVPCTTFNPQAPQGAHMTQTYCNPTSTIQMVTPYYVYPDGSKFVFVYNCLAVQPGETVDWYHSRTVKGTNYGTAKCVGGEASSPVRWDLGYQPGLSCWTNFRWSDDTTALIQRFGNCTPYTQWVAPAYVSANGSLNVWQNMYTEVRPMSGGEVDNVGWRYNMVLPVVYTTVTALYQWTWQM